MDEWTQALAGYGIRLIPQPNGGLIVETEERAVVVPGAHGAYVFDQALRVATAEAQRLLHERIARGEV